MMLEIKRRRNFEFLRYLWIEFYWWLNVTFISQTNDFGFSFVVWDDRAVKSHKKGDYKSLALALSLGSVYRPRLRWGAFTDRYHTYIDGWSAELWYISRQCVYAVVVLQVCTRVVKCIWSSRFLILLNCSFKNV